MASSALVMAPVDVYNMDVTGPFYCAQANKTLAQGKVLGCNTPKDCLNLALDLNMTNINKLKHVKQSLHPRCFGMWLPMPPL